MCQDTGQFRVRRQEQTGNSFTTTGITMKVKQLITKLMEGDTSDEVYVRTEKGLKKVKAVIPTESDDDNPARYFTELMLED